MPSISNCTCSNLIQHVTEPSRHREGQHTILDLVLTDSDMIVQNIDYLPPLAKSDHSVLVVTTKKYSD